MTEMPKLIKCSNCGHKMIPKDYGMFFPENDTPKENIHITYNKWQAYYSILCPCGHYMMNIPKDDPRTEQLGNNNY